MSQTMQWTSFYLSDVTVGMIYDNVVRIENLLKKKLDWRKNLSHECCLKMFTEWLREWLNEWLQTINGGRHNAMIV